jgi:hypothetical protein
MTGYFEDGNFAGTKDCRVDLAKIALNVLSDATFKKCEG